VLEQFILLVSPFAPHLAEEIWSRLGHGESLAYESWPELNEKYARDDEVEVAVQIKGKVKARIMVPADADEKHIEQAALADAGVVSALAGQTVRKVIVVKGRLVNIVT
jgi:leucyl-tRNA synthetase